MTGDLLVIVPSRGRPQNIARLLDSLKATCKLCTHLHVCIDNDDPELDNYKLVMKRATENDILEIGPRKGLCEWTNKIAVPAAENYPYLASIGDDHVPVTPGWDRALVKAIERMGGTGFSYPWDDTREDIPEAVVVSSNIIRELGWFCMPDLSHWFCDTVWADLGRGIGALRHCRAIKVGHQWKADQTSEDSGKAFEADRRAYYEWRKTRMAEDIAILAGLKEKILQPA